MEHHSGAEPLFWKRITFLEKHHFRAASPDLAPLEKAFLIKRISMTMLMMRMMRMTGLEAIMTMTVRGRDDDVGDEDDDGENNGDKDNDDNDNDNDDNDNDDKDNDNDNDDDDNDGAARPSCGKWTNHLLVSAQERLPQEERPHFCKTFCHLPKILSQI